MINQGDRVLYKGTVWEVVMMGRHGKVARLLRVGKRGQCLAFTPANQVNARVSDLVRL